MADMPTQEQQAQYEKQFSERFDQGTSEQWGSSGLATFEIRILRELFEQGFIKADIREMIINDGWIQPKPGNVTAEITAEAAVEHACGVAGFLVRKRRMESSPSTVRSYTSKNAFDRYVLMQLIRTGRFRSDEALRSEWLNPQDRQPGYTNENLKYPRNIDQTKIFGVSKPHRYWPAQLMKNLELIRLNKATEEERKQFKVGDTSLKCYEIKWERLNDTIRNSDSVDNIAVNVALDVARILKENGLNEDQLVEIFVRSYSPGGPLNEHGNLPQVHEIWSRLLDGISDDNDLANLREPIEKRVKARMKQEGVEFQYVPAA